MNDILQINAHLKYVEFLLTQFDNESDEITLGEIRTKFKAKFSHQDILLNQFFGIYRLVPLILMKEVNKKQKKELVGDIEKVKIIRDSIVHHDFSMNENGYTFKDKKKVLKFSYTEFKNFLDKVEVAFYNN